ncbi:MAG TPA: hypothetical protein VEU33_12630 [Archangium sp.]|nr:hypothetical protein [Archangium sp.]
MRRQLLSTVYGTLLVGSSLLSGCASVSRTAYPPIQADTSAEALARGESLFHGARYRGADDVDLKALYEYPRSLPPRRHDVPGARPHTAPEALGPSAPVTPASVSTRAVQPGTPVRTSAAVQLATLVLAQAEPRKEVDPAALFARLGCTLCHASGARYHERIVQAAGKSEQELAKWIRNPEQFVPGTTMPTYASLVDEPTARALARWIKSGGPASRK